MPRKKEKKKMKAIKEPDEEEKADVKLPCADIHDPDE
jgi:hypothetical protein